MINESKDTTTTYILSDAAQKAYEKIKALILRIFSLFKNNEKEKNLKEQFYDSYIDFSRRLKAEGYVEECYIYMSICEMYYRLIDKPEELIANEEFFTELFEEFDELLFVRINKPAEYKEKYDGFRVGLREKYQYYYTQVATPSKHYDKEVLNDITKCLVGK